MNQPPAQTESDTPAAPATAARPFRVWDWQPSVEHYRVPIWDGLIEAGRGLYELTVCGTLSDGGAKGGGRRPYFRDFPLEEFKRFGVSLCQWRGAEQAVRTEQPDVVIVSANARNRSNWRLPNIVHSYGGAAVCWTKVHSYSGIPRPLLTIMKKRFYRRFDRAICYGRQSRQELIALGFPADRARVAQNTIDTRRIFEQGEDIRQRGDALRDEHALRGATVLLCIGRMDPDKRHQDLLDAWPKLGALSDDLHMVLVSGGPLLDDIRRQARRIDPDRIHVTGRVPEGDDYAWIATADLAVYPGAVGLAINQSLAFGRPTIIADEYGADSEILRQNETGWRYPRGDLDALVATVEQVLGDADQRQRITARARQLMRDEVTVENMIASIDQTIRDALKLTAAWKERGDRS